MKIPIPTTNNENVDIQLKLGESSILIGANGAGKTRLSVYLQDQLPIIKSKYNIAIQENIRYKAEIEKWKNKKDEQIEKEFNQYKTLKIKTEKGEIKTLSFYEVVENSLRAGFFNLFVGNTINVPGFTNLDGISGGIIGRKIAQILLYKPLN